MKIKVRIGHNRITELTIGARLMKPHERKLLRSYNVPKPTNKFRHANYTLVRNGEGLYHNGVDFDATTEGTFVRQGNGGYWHIFIVPKDNKDCRKLSRILGKYYRYNLYFACRFWEEVKTESD